MQKKFSRHKIINKPSQEECPYTLGKFMIKEQILHTFREVFLSARTTENVPCGLPFDIGHETLETVKPNLIALVYRSQLSNM